MIDPLWSIELKPYNLNICKDLEEEEYLKQNRYTSIKVSKTYFNLCMSNNGDVHTISESIPPIFW